MEQSTARAFVGRGKDENMHHPHIIYRALGALLLSLLLTACGGGGGSTTASGQATVLATVSGAAPLANCPSGGISVDSGIDTNGNGQLDAAEVTGTQYVCNGTAGSNGLSMLVAISDEAAGANCSAGGKKINAGADSNASGVLDAGEISTTSYVCNGTNGTNGSNGANGTNGSNGSNGLNTLMAIVSEAAGANCTYGGNKITSGVDLDADGVLDALEITATSYVCNGTPAGIPWVDVTGTAVPAQPNTGYIAHNDTAQVTITLPTNPAFGDVVRVNGLGAGGWKIAQNAGQQVLTANLPGGSLGGTWTTGGGARQWTALASSANGRKLAAGVFADFIYVSQDGGLNWSPRASSQGWNALAMSGDGQYLVAGTTTGNLYRSTDGGLSWTELVTGPSGACNRLSASTDGRTWAAAMTSGQVYISEDSGATWTDVGVPGLTSGLAVSADGSKIVGSRQNFSVLDVFVLTKVAGVWSVQDRLSPTSSTSLNPWLTAIALSSDGSSMWVAEYEGFLYSSTDDGAHWTPHFTDSPRPWQGITLSADGSRLAAQGGVGSIHLSSDSGATWRTSVFTGNWLGVVASADGNHLLARQSGVADLVLAQAATTAGTAGSISGRRYDALELQYLGSGEFNVLSYAGSFVVE
jgi:hypothetical protein